MAQGSGTTTDPWMLTTAPAYHARAIEDLHAWPRERGRWVDLGAADEKKPAGDGTVEALGLVELTHEPRNNRVRALSA